MHNHIFAKKLDKLQKCDTPANQIELLSHHLQIRFLAWHSQLLLP